MRAQEAKQFKLFNDFWILEFTVIIDMALKRAKYDLNGDKIAIFATKSQISPSSPL